MQIRSNPSGRTLPSEPRAFCALSLAVAVLTAASVRAAASIQAADDEPIVACTSTPDLAALVREIGGPLVQVTSLVKGPQDAHHLEARPSFVRRLRSADLYVENGLELESAWSPVLLRASRNPRIAPGADGYLDASVAIRALAVPRGPVDRSEGHVHTRGNPHYLLDPIRGLRVARALRDRLADLRPEGAETFRRRYLEFEARLAAALFGAPLAQKYGKERSKLIELLRRGGRKKFVEYLESQDEAKLLGGWIGRTAPLAETRVLADHDLWIYFADRFDIRVAGLLEPKPGLTPTTKHLAGLVKLARKDRIRALLLAPYFDERHARFMERHAEVKPVPMAHQVGARDGTSDYIGWIDYNVTAIERALQGGEPKT